MANNPDSFALAPGVPLSKAVSAPRSAPPPRPVPSAERGEPVVTIPAGDGMDVRSLLGDLGLADASPQGEAYYSRSRRTWVVIERRNDTGAKHRPVPLR